LLNPSGNRGRQSERPQPAVQAGQVQPVFGFQISRAIVPVYSGYTSIAPFFSAS